MKKKKTHKAGANREVGKKKGHMKDSIGLTQQNPGNPEETELTPS